jgi:hypothetical protein
MGLLLANWSFQLGNDPAKNLPLQTLVTLRAGVALGTVGLAIAECRRVILKPIE